MDSLSCDLLGCVFAHLTVGEGLCVATVSSHFAEEARRKRRIVERMLEPPFYTSSFHEPVLYMSGREVGDADFPSLGVAIRNGAFANLHTLVLSNNQIGDAGVADFVRSCGGLEQVQALFLSGNRIGDEGVASLALACRGGLLSRCKVLDLAKNAFHDAGVSAFAEGVLPLGSEAGRREEEGRGKECIPLPKLFVLGLCGNPFGEEAASSLADALGKGALPSLELLVVEEAPLPLREACVRRRVHYCDVYTEMLV